MWLFVLAGAAWTSVGVILCRLSYTWLEPIDLPFAISYGLIGLVLAWILYRFGFFYFAQKNIDRIGISSGKRCLFAFQTWKSYLLICVMITLGIVLRNSPIPKHYLSVMYTMIGGALILSSFRYYFHLWRVLMRKKDFVE